MMDNEQRDIKDIIKEFGDILVDVEAELARKNVKIREMLTWEADYIVRLNKTSGEAIDILVNKKPIAYGEIIVLDDKFGIRLTDVYSDEALLEKIKMAFTSGNILILLFLLLSSSLYSANLEFIYDNNTMNVKLLFTQEFSVHEPKKEGRIFSVRLKTNEALDNITKEFWGYPLERVFTTSEGMYKLINLNLLMMRTMLS